MGALVVWLVVVLIAYILAVTQIYACYRFKAIQSSIVIQRRYPQLVLIESYAVIIFLMISLPLWLNDLFKTTTFGIPQETFFIISTIITSIAPFTHFIMVTEITRLWLVSYDLHYLHSSKNEQWKSQIDTSYLLNDWYIKNKNKYGDAKYVMKRMFLYYLFAAGTIYVLSLVHRFGGSSLAAAISSLTDGLLYFIDTFAIFYMYYKCRKYAELNDTLLFHYEFRSITRVYVIGFLFYLLGMIFLVCGMVLFFVFTLIFSSLWVNTAPSLMSTLRIPRKIASDGIWSDDLLREYSSSNQDVRMMVEMQKHENKNGNTSNDNGSAPDVSVEAKLYEALKNEQEFEKFIQWMYREFSSESPLCFVELVQFKEYVVGVIDKSNNNNNESKSNGNYEYINSLYDTIPKSSVVYTKNEEKNTLDLEEISKVKMMAQLLYDKYIKNDAELEVNLAFKLKRKYMRFAANHWNMDIEELVNVFDVVLHEMFLFMRNSYLRYQKA